MPKTHCHTHNLVTPQDALGEKQWGITVKVPATDPFNLLVGGKFEKAHWFATRQEREATLASMRNRHGFNRIGDDPSIVLSRVDPETPDS